VFSFELRLKSERQNIPLSPLGGLNHICWQSSLGAFYRRRTTRPHKETSDVFSPKYRANTLLRIHFSADVIINTSSNIRFYTALAMHLLGMRPNMTYLWYWRIDWRICVKFLTYFCKAYVRTTCTYRQFRVIRVGDYLTKTSSGARAMHDFRGRSAAFLEWGWRAGISCLSQWLLWLTLELFAQCNTIRLPF